MQATHNPAQKGAGTPTRRVDGQPETEADRRFFDLRGAGYTDSGTESGTVARLAPVTTAATTLRDAARYLVVHGWIRGAYYEASAGSFTPAACMVGAIGMVCYGGPVDAPAQNVNDPGFSDFEAAVTYLDECLTDWYGMVSYEFNDARGRITAEVLRALNDAAAQWDRLQGGAA